jgi:uncharacterized protein (TIGR02145 family)
MGKIQHKDAINTFIKIGLFSGSLLITALAVYFYSPVISSHADTSASENVDVRLNIKPTIALTTDVSELDLDARLNEFVSGSVNVDVITNSQYGYTLAFEDADNDTNMNSTSNDVTDLVTSTFTGSKTSSTMDGNTWGYSLDATNFYKIPVNGSYAVIGNTHVPTPTNPGYNRTTVNFGVKVGSVLTSGTYADTVLFTAYVNGQDYNPLPKTLHSISTMQEMTSAVCDATTLPSMGAANIDWDGSHHGDHLYVPRKSLRDTRDGKYYLVSKLADGNCWMSQNLAFDLTAGTPFIASNNDGTTTIVTPDTSTQTATGTDWSQSYDAWHSYKAQANEAYYKGGTTKSSTPTDDSVEYDWEKAGNYYNWYTATAGSGTHAVMGAEASSSICPKGWRLPKEAGRRLPKNYSNLIEEEYFMRSSYDSAVKLRSDPFNFLQSGYYNNSRMQDQSTTGAYWSSMASEPYGDEWDGENAYSFEVKFTSFYPTSGPQKYQGNSVRCVSI